jgi:uncharacterized protein YndB with AHSA1/START domain
MNVIQKEIRIRASREVVWRYFSDSDLLAAWLMRNDFTGSIGSNFHFFAQSSSDWNGHLDCTLLEFEPPKRIVFTWNANNIGTDTVVTIDLLDRGKETQIRLVHANFEGAAGDVNRLIERHDAGWADHLLVLKLQSEEKSRDAREETPEIDWTRFDLHVAIQADPHEILSYWSTIRGMERFFVEMMRITGPDGRERDDDEAAQPGDSFIWRWHNGRCLKGQYLSPQANHEVRFSFGESNVAVRAIPYRDGSLLRLSQYDMPDTEQVRMHVHANCRAAWVYFLTILKTLIEHGVDARDTKRETGSSFSTYFDPRNVGVEF